MVLSHTRFRNGGLNPLSHISRYWERSPTSSSTAICTTWTGGTLGVMICGGVLALHHTSLVTGLRKESNLRYRGRGALPRGNSSEMALPNSVLIHYTTQTGGRCGIRTHGAFQPTRFPSVPVKPLWQTSWRLRTDLNRRSPP